MRTSAVLVGWSSVEVYGLEVSWVGACWGCANRVAGDRRGMGRVNWHVCWTSTVLMGWTDLWKVSFGIGGPSRLL